MKMKEFNSKLEIDILRNSSQKYLGVQKTPRCPAGCKTMPKVITCRTGHKWSTYRGGQLKSHSLKLIGKSYFGISKKW